MDTNVLFSAFLSGRRSVCAQLLSLAPKQDAVYLCDFVIAEMLDIVNRKLPERKSGVNAFLASFPYKTVPSPALPAGHPALAKINDPKDAVILNAAIQNNIEIIVSGDPHFQNAKINELKVLSPAAYLAKLTPSPTQESL
jgi:predicted nucleic acid-binding protein